MAESTARSDPPLSIDPGRSALIVDCRAVRLQRPRDGRSRRCVTPGNVTGAPPPQVTGLLRPRRPLTRPRGGSATGFLSRRRRNIPSPQARDGLLVARSDLQLPVPAAAARAAGRRTSISSIASSANAIGRKTLGAMPVSRCIVAYRRQSTPRCFIRARGHWSHRSAPVVGRTRSYFRWARWGDDRRAGKAPTK